jgi:ribonuclease Z
MHGDHVLGLPGLLLMAQIAGRDRKAPHKIDIYGPPGLYNYIVANIILTRASMNAVEICVYELVGGKADAQLKGQIRKDQIIHGEFSHLFQHNNIERRTIEPNENGTWIIEREREKLGDDFDVDRGGYRPVNISAAEVTHVDTVQTFGYVVSEAEPIPKIDAEKATKLGVAPSKKYRQLKNGFPVTSDDGLRTVQPDQVLTSPNRKERKIAVIGDNCGLSQAMEQLCWDADVVVHEAILSHESAKVSTDLSCDTFFSYRID